MILPKKSLGQHFLHDGNILRKIAAVVDPQSNDTVIEIGPGTGALTRLLAGTCTLIGVEIDGRAIASLREEFGADVEILHGDIRDMDLSTLSGTFPVRIVGNIPYNITSDILFWIFDNRGKISDATLMMQAEVAERLIAVPRTKQYGILSVSTQVYGEARKAFRVSRRCFTPAPDVDSTVVHIRLATGPAASVDPAFRRLVRGLFGKRRKTIRNGLRHMGIGEEAFPLAAEHLDKRPEELTPAEFVRLTEKLGHFLSPGTGDHEGKH